MKFLFNLLVFAGIMAFVGACVQQAQKNRAIPVAAAVSLDSLDFIRPVPSTRHCYRSAQLTAAQLEQVLQSGDIDYVLRYNGDSGRDQGALPHAQERAICEKYNVGWKYYNLDTYPPDHPRCQGQLREIEQLVNAGGVLMHCRNGLHRVGLVAGLHMAKKGYTWEAIIAHNGWDKLAERPGAYAVYVEPVFYAVNH